MLCRIKRAVRVSEDCVSRSALPEGTANADRCVRDTKGVLPVPAVDGEAKAFGSLADVELVLAGENEREFLCAQTLDGGAFDIFEAVPHEARHVPQHRVPHNMPLAVVDRLEMIDVRDQQRLSVLEALH